MIFQINISFIVAEILELSIFMTKQLHFYHSKISIIAIQSDKNFIFKSDGLNSGSPRVQFSYIFPGKICCVKRAQLSETAKSRTMPLEFMRGINLGHDKILNSASSVKNDLRSNEETTLFC